MVTIKELKKNIAEERKLLAKAQAKQGLVSEKDKQETRDSWNATDVITSSVVIILIMAAYLYFTG